MNKTPISDLADWSVKRAGNLNRMLEEAKKDDLALYTYVTELVDSLSAMLSKLGDEAGSVYAASLARLLENKRRTR